MKRFLRIFFNSLTILSPLFCLATAVLWVRSQTLIDYIHWTDHRHFPALVSSDGRIIYSYQFWSGGVGGNRAGFGIGSRPGDPPYWERGTGEPFRNHFAGFEWSPVADVKPSDEFIGMAIPTPTTFLISVPHWFICLLASIPILLRLRSWRRRPLPDVSICQVCGYDLRATPDKCPECGTQVLPLAQDDTVSSQAAEAKAT